jgi:hypothetical protein
MPYIISSTAAKARRVYVQYHHQQAAMGYDFPKPHLFLSQSCFKAGKTEEVKWVLSRALANGDKSDEPQPI